MLLKIRTLTPLWTGNIDRKCEKIKETGIIGSLRWWYEALVRGLDRYACDPTNSNCKDLAHCNACNVFGCTGWKRRFRLKIIPRKICYAPFVITRPAGAKKQTFLGHCDNGGVLGEFDIDLMILDKICEKYEDIFKCLIKLSVEWGMGARTQTGFGILFVENELNWNVEELPSSKEESRKNYCLPLPRIDQFFFYIIPIKESMVDQIMCNVGNGLYKTMSDLRNKTPLGWTNKNYIPSAPWVRRAIRGLFSYNDDLRHYLMGFISSNKKPLYVSSHKVEKTGSKIYVSHIYNRPERRYEMKVWGWIPDILPVDRRDHVKKILEENLENETFWKDCFSLNESPVDVVKIKKYWDPKVNDILDSNNEFWKEVLK